MVRTFESYQEALIEAITKTEGLPAKIEASIRLIKDCASKNKKIMLIGNGGSAGIASHLAVDFWKNAGIRAIAFNDSSLLTCVSNDCGYEQVFAKPIAMFADEGDVLIAISSSGRSPNILNGVKAARKKGCQIIALSGFLADNPLRRLADIDIYVPAPDYVPLEDIHHFICHCLYDIIRSGSRIVARTARD